ncbi:uncharacterized protein LOC123301320 [Chrysoperla carnea]|uniref:uncharacterized protein LOC123301320 n=1 Tax=Chrysoperla carnea TaxID=189513 RepID=UPI001D081A63|nr:uncharacterized protein LOC123301320 [Chrysoperla carnea]
MSKRQHNYTLVCFIDELLKNNKKSIDVVPSSWLCYKKNDNSVLCPFISDCSSNSDMHQFHEAVKSLQPPSKSWKLYPIEIKGYASNYEEALKKLATLEVESDVFSSDFESKNKSTDKNVRKQNRLKGQKHRKVKNYQSALLSTVDLTQPIDANQALLTRKRKRSSQENKDSPLPSPETSQDNTSVENESRGSEEEATNSFSPAEEAGMIDNRKAVESQLHHSQQDILNTIVQEFADLKQTFSNSFMKLTGQISTMQSEIIAMKIAVERFVDHNPNRLAPPTTKHHITLKLPFTTVENFKEFDAKIKVDEALRNEVFDIIWAQIDVNQKSINKVVGNIFLKFCSRELLENYTAKKPVAGKHVMSETEFYKCAYSKLNEVFKNEKQQPITDTNFYKSLGAVFNSAKDREGQRNLRRQKKQSENLHDAEEDSVFEEVTANIE